MRTLSEKMESGKRYIKHPDYKIGLDMLQEWIDECKQLEEQLKNCNLQNVSQQRELLYGFITWYNSKPKVQKGEHVYTTDVDEFLKP